MRFIAIIPARYASTRFPGKPLALINGKPMIQRVYEQAKKATVLADVYVATDDKRIEQAVLKFGGKVIMTSSKHLSGTDRCAEAMKRLKLNRGDVVVNIQGDEPFIRPAQISKVCSCFKHKNTSIATLIKKIQTREELFSVNTPKVVVNSRFEALYFSRTPIPFLRGADASEWLSHHTYYKHIGIYAYRAEVLKKIAALRSTALEKAESLEQLRWLQNGFSIQAAVTGIESQGIDTPDDLRKYKK